MKHDEIFNLVEIVRLLLEIAVIHDMVKNDWTNKT